MITANKPSGETMDEGSDIPPDAEPSEDSGMKGPGELCVPIKAVAVPDENESAVAPEVGDEVNFSGSAKVTRVEGGNVYLTPTEINGEKLEGAPETEEEPDADADMHKEMMSDAGKKPMY